MNPLGGVHRMNMETVPRDSVSVCVNGPIQPVWDNGVPILALLRSPKDPFL